MWKIRVLVLQYNFLILIIHRVDKMSWNLSLHNKNLGRENAWKTLEMPANLKAIVQLYSSF